MAKTWTGGCTCGAIRYEVEGDPSALFEVSPAGCLLLTLSCAAVIHVIMDVYSDECDLVSPSPTCAIRSELRASGFRPETGSRDFLTDF